MNLNKQVFTTEWTKPISNIEHKLKIALMIAQKAKDGDVIGFDQDHQLILRWWN